MPFTLLLPASYGSAPTQRYPVLTLLHGGASHHAEWAREVPLAEQLAGTDLLVVMPEGEHGLYLNGANGQRYEDYLLEEVPAYVETHFRVRKERSGRALAGLSMGGFGSMNLGLKHPERYAALGSLSGAFGMTWWNLGQREGSPYLPVLGPPGSEQRHAYNPWRVLEAALAQHPVAALPSLFLEVGTEDDPDVLEANRNYHQSLQTAGVPHLYAEAPGGHDWDYWRRATPRLLQFVAGALGDALTLAPS